MELAGGVCGMCTSKCLVLNPKDSEKYFKLIFSHFHNELNISNEYYSNFSLCATCIHHITLLNSNKDYFLHEDKNAEIYLNDKCALCTETIDLFSINDSNFLNKCTSWIKTAEGVKLCASCLFLIEVRQSIKTKLSIKLSERDDQLNISAKSGQKGPISRRKSTYEEVLSNRHQEVLINNKESPIHNPNISESPSCTLEMDSTPVRNKRKRKGKNLRKHLGNSISKVSCELVDYNLSNIKKLSPLCNSKVDIPNDIKSDNKMYNCIPFVKLKELESRRIKEYHGNYVCSLVSQRPMIRMRRTPPIKIRCIKNIVLSKKKSKSRERKENKLVSNSIETLQKNKLVVMLERMKMPLREKSISISEGDDLLKSTSTPKKKKHVHFNDTPTIIFTDNLYNEGFEGKNKNDKCKKSPNLRSIMVTEQQKINKISEDSKPTEEEQEGESDNEELITLSIDSGSDDESLKNTVSMVLEDDEDQQKEKEGMDENQVDSCSSGTTMEMDCEESPAENDIDKENSEIKDKAEKNKENSQSPPIAISDVEILSDDEKNHSECHEDSDADDKVESTEKPIPETCDIISSDDDIEEIVPSCQKPEETNDAEARKLVINECLEQIEERTELVEDGSKMIDKEEKEGDRVEENVVEKPTEQVEDERDSLADFEIPDIENTTPDNIGVEESSKEHDVQAADETGENSENKHDEDDEDSLNGFEVIDEDDESNKNRSTQMEIDVLVQKYCEDDSEKTSEKAKKANDNSVLLEKIVSEDVNTNLDTGEDAIEQNEKEERSECLENAEKQSEGFGPLIDEVQKCLLTSTKEAEGGKSDSLVNTSNLLDVLDDSFHESPVKSCDGKGLKRKNCDDQFDDQNHKKVRSENI